MEWPDDDSGMPVLEVNLLSEVAQPGGSNTERVQDFVQPEPEENVVSTMDASAQTEQQIEINEQPNSEPQKSNWK